MNIQKLVPGGLKILQMVRTTKNIAQIRLHPDTNQTFKIKMYYVAMAFLWPFKKKDDPKSSEVDSKIYMQADNLFENGYYEECYHLLTNSDNKNMDDVEIQWRRCRVLYNMSREPKYDENFKKQCILEAYDIIAAQIEGNQDNYAVHKWYALLLDARSSIFGVKERVKQLQNVKKHMDLAVIINPNDATTLHMLGEWCFQVAEMPWHQRRIAEVLFASPPHSTYEDALEYFLRAETVQPRFYSVNLLRLGTCYLRLNKDDQAKYYLKLAACYPAKSNDDHYANKEATDLLKRYKLN